MASVNITPLTDVLLVLLITFLLSSASFQGQDYGVNLPRVLGQHQVSEVMFPLAVNAKGEVRFEDKPLTQLPLEEALRRLRQNQNLTILGLAVDRELDYAKFYEILQAAQAAGWERTVLLVQEPSS